ncbi:MAG: HIT domain-containing protein [Nitrospirae bacterium]|nr:MAG: HIT domain-containing protein [Nitrospirota bacterium]
MPEMRLNTVTREWVVIEKNPGIGPTDFVGLKKDKELSEVGGICHFCPGNEYMIPEETDRIEGHAGWKIRVVRNKFSRLSEEGDQLRWGNKIQRGMNAVGFHEIIVETPEHDTQTATMPTGQLKALIEMYKYRFVEFYKDPRVEYVVVFKNKGLNSGTTCDHSLSQVVGIPIVPLEIRDRTESYMRFFDDTGECLMCKMIYEEMRSGARIICNTDHFVSFLPYAAMSPFHVWIFPKRHSGSFADITNEEMRDLAINLKTTMYKIAVGLDNPDYNYAIRSGKPSNSDSKFEHWYLTIVPRVGYLSGFEIACGIHVNPIQPELSARFLREVPLPKPEENRE